MRPFLKRIFFSLMMPCLLSSSFLFSVSAEESAATAPPMGFNTWYIYLDGWTENTIKETVQAMKSLGLRDLGYRYIQLDWGWCAGDRSWYDKRTENGKMNPDPLKFSSNPILLANYLHKRGFLIGFYTDTGFDGVGNGIGSAGHYQSDMEQFIDWKMDFVKFDSGGGAGEYPSLYQAYRALLTILNESDSDTPVPVCLCGLDQASAVKLADEFVGEKIPFLYYRVAADISCTIPIVKWDDPTYSVLATFDAAMAHPDNSRPGLYFDMDTLMLENNGLTAEENKAYMTMFCIAPSTLFLAVDIPHIQEETLALITNEEAIAVNQDPLCHAARLVREDSDGLQVYSKVQSDNLGRQNRAVMLLNRTASEAEISVNWSDIGLSGTCLIRDIWEKADVEPSETGYSAVVPSHGVVFLTVTETAVTSADSEPQTDSVVSVSAETESGPQETKPAGSPLLVIGILAAVLAGIAAAILIVRSRRRAD